MHSADRRLLWRIMLVGSLFALPGAFVAAELSMPLPKAQPTVSVPGVPASTTPTPVPPPSVVPVLPVVPSSSAPVATSSPVPVATLPPPPPQPSVVATPKVLPRRPVTIVLPHITRRSVTMSTATVAPPP